MNPWLAGAIGACVAALVFLTVVVAWPRDEQPDLSAEAEATASATTQTSNATQPSVNDSTAPTAGHTRTPRADGSRTTQVPAGTETVAAPASTPSPTVPAPTATQTATSVPPTSTPIPPTATNTPVPTATLAPVFVPQPTPSAQVVVQSCIEGSVSVFQHGTFFPLCNGQAWVQTSFSYEYHYAYRPDVVIATVQGGYVMLVEGLDDWVAVEQVSIVADTCIEGDFEGWEGETLFPLCNGQLWQQADYAYRYMYAYRPRVLIFQWGGYYMLVEDEDEALPVFRVY